MLRFVTLFCGVALAVAAPNTNIFKIDLDPEEAAQYLNSPPFTEPQLSGRTAILPLVKYNDPRFRAAEAGPTLGHYWKNGKEIDNTDDYVEEVYNAAQYHGQDGLGAYAYGYETPESSKVENKQRSGDVTGSYTYRAGSSNDLIKVRYWADSQGFHQEDNLPKYVPKPVEEAPEVRAARLAHEKAWQEAAYANLHPGAAAQAQANIQAPQITAYQGNVPQNNYNNYNQQYSQGNSQQYTQGNAQRYTQGNAQQYSQSQGTSQGNYNDYQTQASEQQGSIVPAPGSQARQGKAYEQYDNQYDQYSTTTTTEEPTGPPRGFFYSFQYPVSIIVPKNEQQGGSANPGYPVDNDTVALQGRSK